MNENVPLIEESLQQRVESGIEICALTQLGKEAEGSLALGFLLLLQRFERQLARFLEDRSHAQFDNALRRLSEH